MLGYMPRKKPRVEYVSISPDGFRYRGRVHGNINNLLKWFKEHFRDPVPGAGAGRRQYGQTPLSMGGSVSGATPYTPSATPSNLLDENEANNLMQQYQYGDSRVTPAYSTSGFTPSETPTSNFGDSNFWGGTPRTPRQHTPQMHHQGDNRQYHNQRGKQRHYGGGGGRHNRR